MKRLLILITASPPYTPGEEFLNEEYKVLEPHFDRIIVIHHNHGLSQQPTPASLYSLRYFPYLPSQLDKIRSFASFLDPAFWEEAYELIFRYRLLPTPSRLALLLGSMVMGKKLNKLVLEIGAEYPDHQLYAYSYWCNFMAVGLAFVRRRSPEITCISRTHGYDLYFDRSPNRYQPLRKFIYTQLNRTYFISNMGLRYAIQQTGAFPSQRLSRLGTRTIGKTNHEGDKGFTWIVSVSATIAVKRIHLIIGALSLFSASPIKIKWTHFGEGPLLNGLQAMAHEHLKSIPNVSFEFKGQVPNEDVLTFYKNNPIDLFINVSESEGIPFSMIEASAAGIPSIATNVGGIQELIQTGKNGFLLSGNPPLEEIKKAIETFALLDFSKRELLSKQSKDQWQADFDANRNYSAFVQDFLSSKSS